MLYLILGAVFLLIIFVSSGKTRSVRTIKPTPDKTQSTESIIRKTSDTFGNSGSEIKMPENSAKKTTAETLAIKMESTKPIAIGRVEEVIKEKSEINVAKDMSAEKNESNTTAINESHSDRLSLARSILESSSMTSIKMSDPSIIDVTDHSEKIVLDQSSPDSDLVPFWPHKYIYSASAIDNATLGQKTFYRKFKSNFLNEIYLNLDGNTNYAFVLYFELLEAFKQHNHFDVLSKQLLALAQICPETNSYSTTFLQNKLREQIVNGIKLSVEVRSDSINLGRLERDEMWGLGNRYKTQLNLNENEVAILNNLIDTGNKFNSIEYCAVSLIKMFLSIIKDIETAFKEEGKIFQEQVDAVAAIEVTQHHKYRPGTYSYESTFKSFINSVYQSIYKLSENRLRDHFDVGRKTDLNWYIHSDNALNEFNVRFQSHLDKKLEDEIKKLEPTKLQTEIELNEYNKARWKGKLEILETDFSENRVPEYLKEINKLEEENKFNPSLENIFFQTSKFLAKFNKIESLKLYIKYLYYDLQSTSFDNKQLTKTIQKNLFKSKEQLRDFEIIVGDLVHKKDLNAALGSVSALYTIKRKKIQLDVSAIKEVHEKHSDTVELLNEYLQDEYNDGDTLIKSNELNNEEVCIEIKPKVQVDSPVQESTSSTLTAIQSQLLDLFFKNSLVLNMQELETYAKSKGVFKNQLIESINEACFEKLDDVLIEEEDSRYTINENYFKTVYSK